MNTESRSIATAVALLFITGGVVAKANESASTTQVRCSGINSCKGQSLCATAKNACAGQNAAERQIAAEDLAHGRGFGLRRNVVEVHNHEILARLPSDQRQA
jgi:hypothetical protein